MAKVRLTGAQLHIFTFCPDCGKKGCTWHARKHREDFIGCRYCDFFFYTLNDNCSLDEESHERWIQKNPDQARYYEPPGPPLPFVEETKS